MLLKALGLMLAAALVWATPGARAQRIDGTIAIGEGHIVWSDVLREERRVFIHTPRGYAKGHGTYPVLYLLDGEDYFVQAVGIVEFLAECHHIPETIVVGIPNTYRQRDLTPPTDNPQEQKRDGRAAGGANSFLRFFTTELAPWMESHYRAAPFRILAGHSYGGLFTLHTLATQPDAFQAYIAMSPALSWNHDSVGSGVLSTVEQIKPFHYLFLSWGNDGEDIVSPSQAIVTELEKRRPRGLEWAHHYYENDQHISSPHRALYDGLETLFVSYQHWPVQEVHAGDFEATQRRYEALSRHYGFELEPPVWMVDLLAESLTKQGHPARAVEVFQQNLKNNPDDAQGYFGLGDAYRALGRRELAVRAYERGIQAAAAEETASVEDRSIYNQKILELREGK